MHRALVFCFLVLGLASPAEAQLLGRASDAVRDGASSASSDDDDESDDNSASAFFLSGGRQGDDWQDDARDVAPDSLIGRASRAVRRPRRGPPPPDGGVFGRREPRESSPDLTYFASCPYDDPSGYLLEPVSADGVRRLARPAVRLGAELGYAIEGAGRGGLSARLSIPFLIDFRVRYSFFMEALDDDTLATAALGRIGLELRLVQTPDFLFRVGAAGLHFHDSQGAVPGLEGTLSFDAFVADPVVLSGGIGVGFVGESISLSGRFTIGAMVDSLEIFAGYHYEGLVVVGDHVHLGGPVAGIRGWL
ncbi:MAG: hypothetical protein AB8I08_11570 [Sandaracinaceae bacterium]